MYKDIDVEVFKETIDAGTQIFDIQGYMQTSAQYTTDINVKYEFLDASFAVLRIADSLDLGMTQGLDQWVLFADNNSAPVGTRWIRIRLKSDLGAETLPDLNFGFFDGITVKGVKN